MGQAVSAKIDPVKTYLVVNQSTRTVEVTVHKDDYDAAVATIQAQNNMLDESRVFRVNLGAELGAVMRERDDLKRRLAEKCDYDAVVKERDDLRAYASQCSLNADNANTALSCACDELETMRAERDELTTDLQNVTNECDTHVKRYGVMQADRDRLAAMVETVRTMALAPHWLTDSRGEGHESVYAANILRALADPADYPRCRECGKWKEKP
jgi:hypothetical protein